jgi:hypothetical protein
MTVSQPPLGYARPRPRGLSPLIDHAGDGYAALRLPLPPLWLELSRLAGILAAQGMFGLVISALVAYVTFDRSSVRPGVWWAALGGIVLVGLTAIAVAIDAVGQGGSVIRALRAPPTAGSLISLRGPTATGASAGALSVQDIEVRIDPPKALLGQRAFLFVRTPDGEGIRLLLGHRPNVLEELTRQLRMILLKTAPAKRLKEDSPFGMS